MKPTKEQLADPKDGLPPTGTVCSFRSRSSLAVGSSWGDWQKCQIVSTTKHYGIIRILGGAYTADYEASYLESHIEFRPVETPEQKAAREREHQVRNACTAIARTLDKFENDIPGGAAARTVIEAMIDAGYRKQPEDK